MVGVESVDTNTVSYLSPQAKLPNPSRENRKAKVRSKRDEFMSDSGLNESMDDACMAEIRLGIAKMDFKKVGNW